MVNVIISNSGRPLLEDDIDNVEQQLGIAFPLEYRRFLLTYNGGQPEPDSFPIFGNPADNRGLVQWFFCIQPGHIYDLLDYIETFKGRIPYDMIPIAIDPGGNLLCLSVSGHNRGKIYFWDHEQESGEDEPPSSENIYPVANSFDELLNSLSTLIY